jgi:hypothetical protein
MPLVSSTGALALGPEAASGAKRILQTTPQATTTSTNRREAKATVARVFVREVRGTTVIVRVTPLHAANARPVIRACSIDVTSSDGL